MEPYAVHCTFQYGANPGKRNRMREAMIFEDEPEYYTGERGGRMGLGKSTAYMRVEAGLAGLHA